MTVRFIHIKKNGGTSAFKFLRKNGVDILVGDSKDRLMNQHSTVHYYLDEDSFKFSIVRNPYDRTVSFYNWIKRIPEYTYSFDTFVKKQISEGRAHGAWRTQASYITDPDTDKILVDKVFSFENMEKELKEHFNINTKFPHLNKGTEDDHASYYTQELKDIVYNQFKKDFILFGYKK